MLFGNSEGAKQPHNLIVNNTLVHRVCETEFVRYYLCLLRAPVINSETKEENQTKRACFIVSRGLNQITVQNRSTSTIFGPGVI